MEEVEDLQGVEVSNEVGNVVEGNGPDVSPKSIGHYTPINDDNGWYTSNQCGQDAVVVIPKFADGEYSLVYDSGKSADSGDDCERDVGSANSFS